MDDRCRLSISRLKNSTIAELGDLHQSEQPIEWWLNGFQLSSTSNLSLFWPMQLDRWSLEVKSESMTDRVNFEVIIAKSSGVCQGFSGKKP
jgi:hypothetical protein